MHRLALGLALAVWPLAARGYRPFDSTDAAVAAQGEVELELGPVGYLARRDGQALVAPSAIVNWGFADGWEAVLEGRHLVELGGAVAEPRLRVQDTALSVKRVLREGCLQERLGPSLATELSFLLPTVNGEPGVGALATLVASQRWPDLTVHLNVALAFTRAHVPGVFAGAILEGHDAWPVRPVAEVLLERERGAPTTVSGLLGAIWRASDALSFDAGLRLARAGGADAAELRAGLTWSFGVGFPGARSAQ